MKVAFDARYLTSKSSGIGTYQSNLVREMLAADPDLHLLLVTRSQGIARQFDSERCQEWIYDVEPRSFRTLFELPRRLRAISFDLFHATLHLASCKILITGVDRLELAAVNRHACISKKIKLAAKANKLSTDFTDRRAIVFTEVGNRFVIWNQAARQRHQFYIASGFTFQTTARLDSVEVAVDIELQ